MPASPPGAPEFSPILWRETLELLDQRLLPAEERWLVCRTVEEVAEAIRTLAVRGAPAIGIAAAYGLVVALADASDSEDDLERRVASAATRLGATRPTAVNLRWALEAGARAFAAIASRARGDRAPAIAAMLAWARELHADDLERNRRMAEHGARLFSPGDRALTHCNAGALATGGIGTAVGVLVRAHACGRLASVWVDETRPLLQGARLTAWELDRARVPHRLVTDSMVGTLMARGLVDRVVVGADRIAANGDFANKIGTYTVAALAGRHRVPFYVAAPRSTFDPRLASGGEIPIEERAAAEITTLAGVAIAPPGTESFNPAFDVTPAELVAGIVTEVGVLLPPYRESIARALAGR
jgi:methylthioribose-1-phosphate isomerase